MPASRPCPGILPPPDRGRPAGRHPRRRHPAPRPHPRCRRGPCGWTGARVAGNRVGCPERRHRQKPLGHGHARSRRRFTLSVGWPNPLGAPKRPPSRRAGNAGIPGASKAGTRLGAHGFLPRSAGRGGKRQLGTAARHVFGMTGHVGEPSQNRHKTAVCFTLLYTKPGVKNNKFSERKKTRNPIRL